MQANGLFTFAWKGSIWVIKNKNNNLKNKRMK
jgi:hypothetical protein